jgi:saccharopine dehydrogenase-like NADP-dependent oxidoreductase
MNTILVLGAGRSSSSLISYLLEQASHHQWQVIVGDLSLDAARQSIGSSPFGRAISFSIDDAIKSAEIISKAKMVISLLPAHLHPTVGKICLAERKHLLTASYVSDEMRGFDAEAKVKGLLFLNECGLDPGIDHMSAMQIVDAIREKGGVITSVESFTGGLLAPETDPENPWRYKFTWNPRNVVMAGLGTAKFLQDGVYKYVSYQQLFKRITSVVVPGFGEYEGYANRDSLKYMDTYGLHGVKTMIRGTLRNKGYCDAWNVLVQLGCCDESYEMEAVEQMTHRSFIESFLGAESKSVEQKLSDRFYLIREGEEMKRLAWSGFFSDEKIGLIKGTPAQIVEYILNKKWKLKSDDKDMIVMWHRFGYTLNDQKQKIQASLIAKGKDSTFTAMAKTVGLPLAIAGKLLMLDVIKERGVVIPIMKSIYTPILKELSELGIVIKEEEN